MWRVFCWNLSGNHSWYLSVFSMPTVWDAGDRKPQKLQPGIRSRLPGTRSLKSRRQESEVSEAAADQKLYPRPTVIVFFRGESEGAKR